MKHIQSILLGFLFIGSSIPETAFSNVVILENSSGENLELGIDANEKFLDVMDRIQAYFENQANDNVAFVQIPGQGLQWNLNVSRAGFLARAKKGAQRDYQSRVTSDEKKEISYIVTTLAYEGLVDIGLEKSSLKKAGDHIKHIHPFRFLMTVFSDERLKAGIAAIRERTTWIRDEFFDGIIGSLREEDARNNLLPFVDDFAKSIKIDPDLIYPFLEKGKWKEFINVLIKEIPREGNPNRYNM